MKVRDILRGGPPAECGLLMGRAETTKVREVFLVVNHTVSFLHALPLLKGVFVSSDGLSCVLRTRKLVFGESINFLDVAPSLLTSSSDFFGYIKSLTPFSRDTIRMDSVFIVSSKSGGIIQFGLYWKWKVLSLSFFHFFLTRPLTLGLKSILGHISWI